MSMRFFSIQSSMACVCDSFQSRVPWRVLVQVEVRATAIVCKSDIMAEMKCTNTHRPRLPKWAKNFPDIFCIINCTLLFFCKLKASIFSQSVSREQRSPFYKWQNKFLLLSKRSKQHNPQHEKVIFGQIQSYCSLPLDFFQLNVPAYFYYNHYESY